MSINSVYRTIAQQLLLYRWGSGCGYPVVASPGKSNHQSGLAIDIKEPDDWQPFLEKYAWWRLGSFDPPHFDYVGEGTKDIGSTAMLAIQKLWNKNHPNERIGEDGDDGSQTGDALNRSPAMGFEIAPRDEKPRVLRLSRPMMEGSDMLKLQEALKKGGLAVSSDGVFGAGTDKAVKEFQQKKSLTAEGIVDSKILALMA
jgi:hypothetical protein